MELKLNEIIKYASIGLAVALISSTSSALTIEASLHTTPTGQYTYNSTLDHKEEVVYEQSGANVNFTQVKGNKSKVIPANKVPGRNAVGYSKLILKKIDEKTVSIEFDRQEYPEKNKTIELKYVARGAFVKGTWSDLIADKDVLIALTPESKKLSESRVRVYMAQVIKSIGDKLLPIGRFKGIELNAQDFKFDMAPLKGSRKQLSQTFKIDTKFKLY